MPLTQAKRKRSRNPGKIDNFLRVSEVDSFVVAMLHFNGTNGSTTFTDLIGNVWTAFGTAQISTSGPKFGTGSGAFLASGAYISAPDSNSWDLWGGSDANKWTIDFWLKFNGDPGTSNIAFLQQFVDQNNFWAVQLNSNVLRINMTSAGVATTVNRTWDPDPSIWYHVAIVKDGVNGYLFFINGIQLGVTEINTNVPANLAGLMRVAKFTNLSNVDSYLNGWVDELRISKGVARWTENFEVPSAEYI